MHKLLYLFLFISAHSFAQQKDSVFIRSIFTEVLNRGECYQALDYLSNKIGGRLSGSPQAAAAVQYTFDKMKSYGFDTVWLQPVMVPHWVRGEKEIAYASKEKNKLDLRVCALGNSVGTGPKGMEAPVIEILSFDELDRVGAKGELKGKIVFFNRPMNPSFIHTGAAYGDAGSQRTRGPAMASKYGAVGVIVRSLSLANDEHPHTGVTIYNDSFPAIPACAVSTKDADELSRLLKIKSAGVVKIFMRTTCQMLPDELSYNVIGELKGSEKPDEVIVIGGHLDAWDNGDGAHDDGAGCVQSMEALRLLKTMNVKPKRTIRCVLFMNEENGVRGGIKYAEWAATNQEKHIAAIESDAGGFTPRGFNATADEKKLNTLRNWQKLLKPYGIENIGSPGGGTDIGPLGRQGVPTIGFVPDSQRYFDYHHTAIDTFDKVNKRELELGAGCMSALVWLLSEYGLE